MVEGVGVYGVGWWWGVGGGVREEERGKGGTKGVGD